MRAPVRDTLPVAGESLEPAEEIGASRFPPPALITARPTTSPEHLTPRLNFSAPRPAAGPRRRQCLVQRSGTRNCDGAEAGEEKFTVPTSGVTSA